MWGANVGMLKLWSLFLDLLKTWQQVSELSEAD